MMSSGGRIVALSIHRKTLSNAAKSLLPGIWIFVLPLAGAGFELTPPADPAAQGITVVSLNVANAGSAAELADEVRERGLDRADVYLLQEVVGEGSGKSRFAEALLGRRRMHVYYLGSIDLDGGRLGGLAIVSRLPLRDPRSIQLKKNNLNFRSRNRIAIGATVNGPSGPVALLTTHLDTRINAQQRLEQLKPIVDWAAAGGLPTIFGGDLNTNPYRWVFHLMPVPAREMQGETVRKYMGDCGFESAIRGREATHDVLGMQLDWVFLKGLQASSTRVVALRNSDHHAVVTTVVAAESGGTQ